MDLKSLRVPLDEVAEAMDTSPDSAMVIDLKRGEVFPGEALEGFLDEDAEDGDEEGDDPGEGSTLRIPTLHARQAIALRERFIETVQDPLLRQRLLDALGGRGAFSRFRAVLRSDTGERDRFFAFVRAELREEARRWLESEGVGYVESQPRASPPPVVATPDPADVGLLDVLLLGAPDGKTELIGGYVARSVSVRNKGHAKALMRRLSQEACALQGLSWHKALLEMQGPIQIDRVRLTVRGKRLEVDVAATLDLWKRFSD